MKTFDIEEDEIEKINFVKGFFQKVFKIIIQIKLTFSI